MTPVLNSLGWLNGLVNTTQFLQYKKYIINVSRNIDFVSESSLANSDLINDERCSPNRN
tara:strand:- start:495 stop:671 length:177 start_codon:yes stop_codon:yes gene_type:complete